MACNCHGKINIWTAKLISPRQNQFYHGQIIFTHGKIREEKRLGSFQVSLRWPIHIIIIHQTHYEKSDWSRAINQFTTACKLDMINAISAADITFIMSSSTSAWLLSPLECSPQKQNGWALRFCFWGWIIWKMYNKTIIQFGFRSAFESLYGGQFTLPTKLIKPNYLVKLPLTQHHRFVRNLPPLFEIALVYLRCALTT